MARESKINISDLNPAQRDAVENVDGPSLIIAGAGSGKTKVLTYKIAYLLDQGVAPNSILALTFTNKASKEMKERISALVGRDKSIRLLMGTFHSIFIRFLRRYAELIGYPSTFTIYDTSDSKSAIKLCLKELELDEKVYKPSYVLSRISNAKNNLITAPAYISNATAVQSDMNAKMGRICDVYLRYSNKCKTAGVMDFDDILLNMNILLRDHPEVCEILRTDIKYILVDEYQDTNYAQYLIIKKLSSYYKNISVVGDDSQSIYGFRGARIQNILNFKKDFPDTKIFRLEQNYRSTQTIVLAANSVIEKNSNRLKKECFSKGVLGDKIEVLKAYTDQEEGTLVASSIAGRIYKDKASYDQFAVLYRTNAQSRIIEEMLRKKNLPYKIYAGHSFFERAEVKDILAYFRLLANPKDDEAFRRVINVPARGIGATSIKYLSDTAEADKTSLWEAVSSENTASFGLKDAALNKIKTFTALVSSLKSKIETEDAYSLATEIANASGLISSLKSENTIEAQARVENIEELLSSVNEFVEGRMEEEAEIGNEEAVITLSDYLENVSLLTDMETSDDKKDDGNKISLMTVHASKGLEFPYVYIVGMEENLFPSPICSNDEEVEEERRLFYVAMTRAKNAITVSFSRSRFKWGQYVTNPPSRFLKEIDSQYLSTDIQDEQPTIFSNGNTGNFRDSNDTFSRGKYYGSSSRDRGYQKSYQSPIEKVNIPAPSMSRPVRPDDPNFTADPVSSIEVGQKVEHNRFGYGRIISISGDDANKKAVVNFDVGGEKTLLLKYAKLKIVAR